MPRKRLGDTNARCRVNMTIGERLAAAAMKYLGVPFHHQGRARKSGLDCIGLLVVSSEDIGCGVVDRADYKSAPNGRDLVNEMESQLDRVDKRDKVLAGDILLFITNAKSKRRLPQHIAIKTHGGLVHTFIAAKRVVENEYTDEWKSCLHSVYRLRAG